MMKKLILALIFALVAVVGLVLGQWYTYITNQESPYDEVGIELNNWLPAPLHDYGCAKLKETFGTKALPPHGCADEQGKGWR